MKKTMLLAAVALSTLAVSTSASALDVGYARTLVVDAFGGGFASLGTLTFLPLGVNGAYCDYLANWYSPFNPNAAGLCVLHELRTGFAPSCIVNEAIDITTSVVAGAGSACGGDCQGFNLKGELFDNVSLILTEGCGVGGCGGLAGIAVFPSIGVPQVYPIRTN